jgi:hypothetical protein
MTIAVAGREASRNYAGKAVIRCFERLAEFSPYWLPGAIRLQADGFEAVVRYAGSDPPQRPLLSKAFKARVTRILRDTEIVCDFPLWKTQIEWKSLTPQKFRKTLASLRRAALIQKIRGRGKHRDLPDPFLRLGSEGCSLVFIHNSAGVGMGLGFFFKRPSPAQIKSTLIFVPDRGESFR